MNVGPAPDLDPLRLKLVQLVDSIADTQGQLHFASISTPQPSTQAPGVLPWHDLLARYNLLLSHALGLGTLLSSVGDNREPKRGEEGRDKKKEIWDGSVVVPAEPVEESKDWLVGMLLRTKQVRHLLSSNDS